MDEKQRRDLISQVIAARGGSTLDNAVRELAATGLGYRRMSAELKSRFGVDVPYQTLARWYGSSRQQPAPTT